MLRCRRTRPNVSTSTSTAAVDRRHTGVLYAAMSPRDRHHVSCAALLRTGEQFLLPAPVLAELDYFLMELTRTYRASLRIAAVAAASARRLRDNPQTEG